MNHGLGKLLVRAFASGAPGGCGGAFSGAFPSATLQNLSRGGANVFAAFTAFANEHGAVNLGQGFPTYGTPDFVKEAAARAIAEEHNQYSRPGGHVRLNNCLAEFYAPLFGRDIDPMNNVVVFNGAQSALFNIILSFCNSGDEMPWSGPLARIRRAQCSSAPMSGCRCACRPRDLPPQRISR